MAYLQVGNRGGKILIYQGYRYQKNRVRHDAVYWRCWQKTCRVALQTVLFNAEYDDPQIDVISVSRHNHPQENDLIQTGHLKEEMINRVREDPSMPIKRVYDTVAVRADAGPHIPEFNTVRSRLLRARSSLIPHIPRRIEDVVIENEWRLTWSGEEFLRHQDNQLGVLIFATNENIRKLQICQDVYIDGTFKTSPKPYKQMLTIHGRFYDRVLVFVICLVTGKSTAQYRHILQFIREEMQTLTNNEWRPRRVVTDFEASLLAAIDRELPNTRANGCYFHFTQNLWKKVQAVGMATDYNQNDEPRQCVRKVMAIGFLPLPLVRQNFQAISTDQSTIRLIERFPALFEFLVYVEGNYINGHQFPPILWNVFGRTSETRTNNHVEGFHMRWNSAVSCRHPSLWLFIRKLKDQQKLTEIEASACLRGEPRPARRRKWREMEERINRLKEEYHTGVRTLDSYWEAIQYAIKVP